MEGIFRKNKLPRKCRPESEGRKQEKTLLEHTKLHTNSSLLLSVPCPVPISFHTRVQLIKLSHQTIVKKIYQFKAVSTDQ